MGMPSKLQVPLLAHQNDDNKVKDKRKNNNLTARMFRRCRSAPTSDCGYIKLPTTEVSPRPTFGMGSPHPAGKAGFILFIYLTIGILCFAHVKDDLGGAKTNTIVDALYFCVVTMTTVGYGDLVPSTNAAKIITCIFVFVGFVIFGLLLGNAANYLVEKQERLVEKAIERGKKVYSESRIERVHCKLMVTGVFIVLLFSAAIAVLMSLEGFNFLDAFYCVCVTVTTLGYGDRSFTTLGGRIFAVIWILVSTVCVGQFILYIAEMVTEERQHALTRWILSRKITYSDIEAADWDEDGGLSLAEFMVYKLKEMGKLEEEDVAAIVKQFQELDIDGSGIITIGDINGGQAP